MIIFFGYLDGFGRVWGVVRTLDVAAGLEQELRKRTGNIVCFKFRDPTCPGKKKGHEIASSFPAPQAML